MGICIKRAVAVLLLLAIPTASFGQYVPSPHDLDRVRARLTETSGTLDLDPLLINALSLQANVCDDAKTQGRRDARAQHNSMPWLATAAIGFFLPILGIGVATLIASGPKPNPKTIAANVDADCYRDGYRRGARRKNVLTTLAASALGTLALILVIAASGGFAVFPAAPAASLP